MGRTRLSGHADSLGFELEPEGPRGRGNFWVRFSRWVIVSPVVWLVALADLAGAVAGYIYWYGSSILDAPWYYWVFVPDCPLAATFMGIALLAYHRGRRWHLLGLLAAATSVKYGLWTMVYWTLDIYRGGPVSFEAVTMSLTHLALLVQGLMLSMFLRYRLVPVVLASLFLVANDLVDYVAGRYPRLPETVSVKEMMFVAVLATAAIIVFWLTMTWVSARRARGERRATRAGGSARRATQPPDG